MLHVMLYDDQGSPATEDFLQLPLDMELRPSFIQAGMMDSFFDVFFSAVPGRVYRVRESPTVQADSFFDVFTELSTEGGDDIQVTIPMMGPQGFIRVVLDPE